MKPEKITIDFATYEEVFTELAKWQTHLERLKNSPCKSEKANAKLVQRANKVQALLDALVEAEFNEE